MSDNCGNCKYRITYDGTDYEGEFCNHYYSNGYVELDDFCDNWTDRIELYNCTECTYCESWAEGWLCHNDDNTSENNGWAPSVYDAEVCEYWYSDVYRQERIELPQWICNKLAGEGIVYRSEYL